MKILGIDTGTDMLGVAIWDKNVIYEASASAPRRHAELLPEFANHALTTIGSRSDEISHIAVAIGPGSYTGLRVGVAFAQGFAMATDAKIITVDSLLAQAARYRMSAVPIAVIVDARAGAIYGAIFDVRDKPLPIVESSLWSLENFAAELSSRGRVALVGADAPKFCAQLNRMVHGTDLFVPSDCMCISAGKVAEIAAAKAIAGEITPLDTLEPKYLREFTPGKRKRTPVIS